MEDKKLSVLFVCTGNVFRSMTAELAARAESEQSGLAYSFASAGTRGRQGKKLRDDVVEALGSVNLDGSAHTVRVLTPEILAGTDLVVAMSTDHRDFLKDQFNRDSVLFREIAGGKPEAFPDLDDVVPDFRTNIEAAREYVFKAIKEISGSAKTVVARIPLFIPE